WQVGRFFALEDAIDIAGGPSELIELIGPIGHQAAGSNEGAFEVDSGQPVLRGKLDDQVEMNERQPARCNDQTAVRRARECAHRALDLATVALVDYIKSRMDFRSRGKNGHAADITPGVCAPLESKPGRRQWEGNRRSEG